MTLRVDAHLYDETKPFSQVYDALVSTAGLIYEIRVAEGLWNCWIDAAHEDFLTNVNAALNNSELEMGWLGNLYGVVVSCELIIRKKTSISLIPGLNYLIFYNTDLVNTRAPTKPTSPDLLSLAQSVTQP